MNESTHGERIDERPEFTCKYCGLPSRYDPSDQVRPVDYCHPEDHGNDDWLRA
jgi:hypothetical protein